MPSPSVDAYAALWCAAVLASVILPSEALPTRTPALLLTAAAMGAWSGASALYAGRLVLPPRWRAWARRPRSSRTLLILGAAVGPSLLLFTLACLRVVANGGEGEASSDRPWRPSPGPSSPGR